jgi:hypothetical protein
LSSFYLVGLGALPNAEAKGPQYLILNAQRHKIIANILKISKVGSQ